MKILFSLFLILMTTFVFIQHQGMVIPKKVDEQRVGAAGRLVQDGQRHIFLAGNDYHRGQELGRLLKKDLYTVESSMIRKMHHFIPNPLIQKAIFTFAMVWFHDIERFIDEGVMLEMQGISQYASHDFDYLADGLTRHLAYHGLHEVGQMFVDEDRVDMGCFAGVFKTQENSWIIGRNFDFDVDGLFDRERILKWTFPEKGNAFLSIAWPGMVGVVTGINEKGLLAFLNSAGSDDFKRVGTPTTLILKKILENATSLEEGIRILEESQTFITDIFLLADTNSKKVALIEKSPKRISIRYMNQSGVISNHLTDRIWEGDRNNQKRMDELTSMSRFERGEEILNSKKDTPSVEQMMLLLRDKSLPGNKKTHLGHRGSIDSLIASQSVIFDMDQGIFYVNSGPGTQGKYIGYNIKKSFAEKMPIIVKTLPEDEVSAEVYREWQEWMILVTEGRDALKRKDCIHSKKIVTQINQKNFDHYDKERLLGDYSETCLGDVAQAKEHWRSSLKLHSPYLKQRKYLEEKLK